MMRPLIQVSFLITYSRWVCAARAVLLRDRIIEDHESTGSRRDDTTKTHIQYEIGLRIDSTLPTKISCLINLKIFFIVNVLMGLIRMNLFSVMEQMVFGVCNRFRNLNNQSAATYKLLLS